jgi:hypothetical protein
LPPAFAIINPNRQDDLSNEGHLAAAGVVFLFLVATIGVLRREGAYRERPEPDLLGLLDLVALAVRTAFKAASLLVFAFSPASASCAVVSCDSNAPRSKIRNAVAVSETSCAKAVGFRGC